MSTQLNRATLAIAIGLLILAAIPRMVNLSSLGFYGDEETTSLPSRAYAEGNGSVMPSGMTYLRAFPHTLMNSLSANIFGHDKELSYRISAAIIGTLTIPVFFLFCRIFFSSRIAFLAALLLALSDWHILTSREARMYAPFLFFYLTTSFLILKWVTTGKTRHLILLIASFAMTIGMHILGVFVVLFFLVPILFRDYLQVKPWQVVVAASGLACVALLYNTFYVEAAYADWRSSAGTRLTVDGARDATWTGLAALGFSGQFIAATLSIGLIHGLWFARATYAKQEVTSGYYLRALNHYSLAILGSVTATLGLIHLSVIILLLFTLAQANTLKRFIYNARAQLAVLIVIYAAWIVFTIVAHGVSPGLKNLLFFPFPYHAYFFVVYPALMFLAAIGILKIIYDPSTPHNRTYVIGAYAIILPFLAVGVASAWGGFRYLIESYPYILILAALGLYTLVSEVFIRYTNISETRIYALCVALVCSGVLGGHGLPQAWQAMNVQYGSPMEVMTFGFSMYPDHKTPGRYVKEHMNQDDVIVAEDALQQYWYTGKVDYWLRDPKQQYHFLYRNQEAEIRDIYVNSQIATKDVIQKLMSDTGRRVWVITSAETRDNQGLYMSQEQIDFLEYLESVSAAVYRGEDGYTSVYCLHCGNS